MTKRDMDERFAIDADPEDAFRALFAAGPVCDNCHHAMSEHVVTSRGRRDNVRCEAERCDCRYERQRSSM